MDMNPSFRTEITVARPKWDLDYETPMLFMGSCFSDSIGSRLRQLKMQVLLNPFGVLYNPFSIARALDRIIRNEKEQAINLVRHHSLYCPLDFHGSFSQQSEQETLFACNQASENAHAFLKNTRLLVVTFGTSWVFRYRPTGSIVANCHKIPDSAFTRERMTPEAIAQAWEALLSRLFAFNPELKVLFTVSPIRHLKDGAHGNQLSKAGLLLAIDHLRQKFSSEQVNYFPSYELVVDELRDYRFYDTDMVHLSETAIDFIFQKFSSAFFTSETLECMKKVDEINRGMKHRVEGKNPDAVSEMGRVFLTRMEKLKQEYPFLDLQTEIDHFQKMIDPD